jgi:hypothetical protein
MALVNLPKLRVHILIKLCDGEVHSKTDLKRELRTKFQLTMQQLQLRDDLRRQLWDRDMVHQLSWLRKRKLIKNEVINGREIQARVYITKLGREILKFCDTHKRMELP